MDWNNVVEAALNTVTAGLVQRVGDAHAFKGVEQMVHRSGEANA